MSTAAQINIEIDNKIKNSPATKLRGSVHNSILKMITGSYYNKDTDYIKFKGVHRTDRVYAQDELAVRYGVLYVCLEDGVTGAWDATKWIPYLDRNPGVLFGFPIYSAATQFLTGQYTEYEHEIFRAKTDVMGTAPDPTQETDDWVKVPHQYNYGDTYRVGLYLDGSVIINNNIFYQADFGASYLESTDFATELAAAKWIKLSDDEAYTDAAITALLGGVAADGDTMAKLRALIQTNEDAISALNALLTSDNPALDDLQELVDAIEALQAFKETIDENSEIIAIIDAGVGDTDWRTFDPDTKLSVSDLTRVSVALATGVIDIDFNGGINKRFITATAHSANFQIILSNLTNAQHFLYDFETDAPDIEIDLGSTVTMPSSEVGWDNGTYILTIPTAGRYQLSGTYDGSEWKVILSPDFI